VKQGPHSRRVLEARSLGSALALTLAASLPVDTARATSFCAASDSVEPMRLVLNIPAARLDVLVAERLTRSYRVAVGTPDHPTPIGAFRVDRIIWNPWWVPPPFDWARDMEVTPPGPDNPTGRVKLFFGFYLFLHGTPLEESIGQAASHGCVRLTNADAIALARAVHAYGSPDLAPAVLDSLVADPDRTRTIRLTRPISLSIVYDRIEVREGRLALHPDPYGRAPIDRRDLVSQLAAVGLPAAGIEPAVLDAALERAERETVTISLRDLRSLD
jgi:murein L,D-transpeptidase YcbB/YkuD